MERRDDALFCNLSWIIDRVRAAERDTLPGRVPYEPVSAADGACVIRVPVGDWMRDGAGCVQHAVLEIAADTAMGCLVIALAGGGMTPTVGMQLQFYHARADGALLISARLASVQGRTRRVCCRIACEREPAHPLLDAEGSYYLMP